MLKNSKMIFLIGVIAAIMTISGCSNNTDINKETESNKKETESNKTEYKNSSIAEDIAQIKTFPKIDENVYDITSLISTKENTSPRIYLDEKIIVDISREGETLYPFSFQAKKIFKENAVPAPVPIGRYRQDIETEAGIAFFKPIQDNTNNQTYIRYLYRNIEGSQLSVTESSVIPYLYDVEMQEYYPTKYYGSDCQPYTLKEDGKVYLKKHDFETGTEIMITELKQYGIGYISHIAFGEKGYVITGSAHEPGVEGRSKGFYAFIDPEGNLVDSSYHDTYVGDLFHKGIIVWERDPGENHTMIDSNIIYILSADTFSKKEIQLEDTNSIVRVSENGKYILSSIKDVNNTKRIFKLYDTETNQCICRYEYIFQEGDEYGGGMSISEDYNAFTYTFKCNDVNKAYIFLF